MFARRSFATFFTKSHHWLEISPGVPRIKLGITEYAQRSLGDAVYIEVSPESTKVKDQEPIGVIESVKSATDINSPVEGTICSINNDVIRKPALLNQDPQGDGWICCIEPAIPCDKLASSYELFTLQEYQNYCQSDPVTNMCQ